MCAVLTAAHCILTGLALTDLHISVVVAAHKLDRRGTKHIGVGLDVPPGGPAETVTRFADGFWVRTRAILHSQIWQLIRASSKASSNTLQDTLQHGQ